MTVYLVVAALGFLSLSLLLASYLSGKINVSIIAREKVEEKEYFALRIESDDFLFLKEEGDVIFIQSLGDLDQFESLTLFKEQKVEGNKNDRLVISKNEKAS